MPNQVCSGGFALSELENAMYSLLQSPSFLSLLSFHAHYFPAVLYAFDVKMYASDFGGHWKLDFFKKIKIKRI